jgi:type I restriction enzyme, S subunit
VKAGWEAKRLGEVVQLEYGKSLAPEDRNPNGMYPAYGANGEKDRTDRFYGNRPSIIVGRKGSAGEITLTEEKYWPLDVTYFAEFDRQCYDLQFLYYLLMTLDLPSLAKGVKPGINRNEVYDLPVMVPLLAEQRRIVAILNEAFEGIATASSNAEKNLQNARDLFEIYLAEAFSQQDEVVPLSLCSTDISDGDHAPPPKSSSGVPFITISNIDKESRRIDFSDTFTVSQGYFDALKPHRKPRKGDVLYTVTGSFGIPVLVEEEGFCFQRHIGLIRPKPGVDSQWLVYALLSPQVRSQAESGATGTAQRTVSLGVLRAMTVPKIGFEEQRAAAARVRAFSEEITRLRDIQRAKLASLDDLKKSLLHQAFTGQL